MPRASTIDLLAALVTETPDLAILNDIAVWDIVKENARRYGVAPLVACAARLHVSPAKRVWCEQVLFDNWKRHLSMLGHLASVLSLFATEGIRTIALKGPLLALRYYDPPFLRKPSLDLDLAVVEDDLERACQVLRNAGYKMDAKISDITAQSHHVELSHSTQPSVELHFRLSHRALGIPVSEFFDRALSCRLPNGQEALILSPADQLLHLVLHLAQSRFGTLFHLCEIRRVCRTEPLEVRTEAINRAISHHYCGPLRMMDIAFRTRWNEPFLPSGVVVPKTWLNWRLTAKLYREFEAWSVPGRALSLPARLRARWLDFQLTDRPVDAARLAIFFVKTAVYYFAEKSAWGTPRYLRFAPNPTRAPH